MFCNSLYVLALVFSLLGCGKDKVLGPQPDENNSVPLAKLVVSQQKAGGRRELRPDLVVSVDSSIWSRYIVEGMTGFTFTEYILDATKSEEDIFVMSLDLVLTISQTNTAGDLINCQLWDDREDGGYPLTLPPNSIATLPRSFATGDVATFRLDRGLVVKKGTIKIITLKCDVKSGADGSSGVATYAWGIKDSPNGVVAEGISSGRKFRSRVIRSNGPPMTLRRWGELEVYMDSSSPPFKIVEAGSLNVTIATLRVVGLYEPIALRQIGLTANSGILGLYTNLCAITKFTVWNFREQVGEGVFVSDNFSWITLNRDLIIPADGQELLTIKVDLSPVGYCAQSGDAVVINYDGEHPDHTWGVGMYSGSKIVSNSNASSVSYGVRIESSLDLKELSRQLDVLQEQIKQAKIGNTLSAEEISVLEVQELLLRDWLHNSGYRKE